MPEAGFKNSPPSDNPFPFLTGHLKFSFDSAFDGHGLKKKDKREAKTGKMVLFFQSTLLPSSY
jgi:hypothetical protein